LLAGFVGQGLAELDAINRHGSPPHP
jgi:hypothetical protein